MELDANIRQPLTSVRRADAYEFCKRPLVTHGGGERWATVCSLIATAKLNDVEPFAYLRDVLQRMVDSHPINRLDDLLPWKWAPTSVNP